MLTPSAVANAKPRATAYKLADERGMFLLVRPSGGKWWRFKYRRPGTRRENLLSLGVYPDVSLKKARERRDEARARIAEGIDPADHRRAQSEAAADTFEVVAREWYLRHVPVWGASHANNTLTRLERDIFPWMGGRPIAQVTARELLASLRRVESRGAIETAHRERSYCSQIMRYAISTGRAERDVAADLRGALAPVVTEHFAAITTPDGVRELVRAIDGFTGSLTVKIALKLSAMLFVRPGELRMSKWSEFDLSKAEWNIPASRTKMRRPLLVPLPKQAVALLRELQPLTGRRPYVFPGTRNPFAPLSDAALNAALRRMGFERTTMTPHGFRAMARTLLDEVLGFRPEVIEAQLGHAVRDPLGRAYNRTTHLAERRRMMQAYADYLGKLQVGAARAAKVGARRTS